MPMGDHRRRDLVVLMIGTMFSGLISECGAESTADAADRGTDATLSCPVGQVMTAVRGSFGPGASASGGGGASAGGASVAPPCTRVSVTAQLTRLCVGRRSCDVECACTHAPAPPAPPPPPPAPPAPPSPSGFSLVGVGSCRDAQHLEPPFWGNDIEAQTLTECAEACRSDPHCTAIGFCDGGGAGAACKGACHVYVTGSGDGTKPTTGTGWSDSGGQGGDAANITSVTDEPWWLCYRRVPTQATVSRHRPGGVRESGSAVGADPVSRSAQCSCSSTAIAGVHLAFPGWLCPAAATNSTIAALDAVPECAVQFPPLAPQPLTTVPTGLRVAFMVPPVVGMDALAPRFSWVPPQPGPGGRVLPMDAQSAAEVVVNCTDGTQWSSGKVPGSTPVLTPTEPLPLVSDQACVATVRVWTGPTAAAVESEPASFVTGLFHQSDWGQARWIGGANLLRKDVVVTSTPARVSIFVGACQYYKLTLDGIPVGNHQLDVVWTRFRTNRSYAAYNLDPKLMAPGKHTLGLQVGEGFCGESAGKAGNHTRSALLRMVLHGPPSSESAVVVTDSTWAGAWGPIEWDSTYFGESVDSRFSQPGWDTPTFVPSPQSRPWLPAVDQGLAINGPTLSSQLQPAIVAVHELKPVAMFPVDGADPPSYTFDFGQEIEGWTRLVLPPGVPAGTNVTIAHAEALSHPPLTTPTGEAVPYDGSAFMGNLFWADPIDHYVASGRGTGETYEPSFTSHGFRVAQVTAVPPFPTPPTEAMLTAVNLRTAVAEAASVVIANPLLQQISNNSWWTEAAALFGVPSGAAGRGERAAWTGDAAFASESELFDFDSAALFVSYLAQIRDIQCDDGTIGNVVPSTDPRRDGDLPGGPNCTNLEKDPSWGTVYPTVAHNMLKYYDARDVVQSHWPRLTLYLQMLERQHNTTGLKHFFCTFGDWNPVVKTPCQITAAGSFLHDVIHMVEMATAIGHTTDAARYTALLATLRTEYHTAFWDPAQKWYGTGTQMAQAMPLWLGVVPPAIVPTLVANLADDVSNNGLSVGFIGVRYLFEALARANRTDAALACLLRIEYPGYGAEIYSEFEPATSLWESWDGDTMHQWLDESSRDHHYQASINTFLRKYVVGLDQPDGSFGWSTVRFRPEPAANLPDGLAVALPGAAVSIATHRGQIDAQWLRLPNGTVVIELEIPAGSVGEVHVPLVACTVGPNATITEHRAGTVYTAADGFVTTGSSRGITPGGADDRFACFRTLSGSYTFTAICQ